MWEVTHSKYLTDLCDHMNAKEITEVEFFKTKEDAFAYAEKNGFDFKKFVEVNDGYYVSRNMTVWDYETIFIKGERK